MSKNNFIRFSSYVDVKYIKSDDNVTDSLEQAILKKDTINDSTIMKTNFDNFSIYGYYIPDGWSSKNSIFTFYKRTPNQNYYQYMCTVSNGIYSISDYNILSNENYHYLIAVERKRTDEITREVIPEFSLYENNDALGRNSFYHIKFTGWSICDIEETDEENVYVKVGSTWNLGLGLGEENGTQNLSITSWDTLNRFPKISVGNRNYDSMSFTGLLGRMVEYDKYNFVKETNQYLADYQRVYQYTEKADTYNFISGSDCQQNYWDVTDPYARETDKLKQWKEFISNGKLKFIRDSKGHGWICQIADSTEYSINFVSNVQQTTVNFSWKEVLDATNISIISQNGVE